MCDRVQVDWERKGSVLLLYILGPLDLLSCKRVEQKIMELVKDSHYEILLDCTSVSYISSAGTRMLLSLVQQIHHHSGILVICSVDRQVMNILKISGLGELLQIFSTQQEALNYLL